MILLSSLIATVEADYLAQSGDAILPSQHNTLAALKTCRTSASPPMQAQCTARDQKGLGHNAGHGQRCICVGCSEARTASLRRVAFDAVRFAHHILRQRPRPT
jgi:hypothetical protein